MYDGSRITNRVKKGPVARKGKEDWKVMKRL